MRAHEVVVRAGAEGPVEVDELHAREPREALDPLEDVVEREREALALHELHHAPAAQVDGRNQHASSLRSD